MVAPDTLLVTPIIMVPGTGALVGGGGGITCSTCTTCGLRYRVDWDIVNNKCLVYNACGVLQSGPGSGWTGEIFNRDCGGSLNLRFDYGDCSGNSCPLSPLSTVDYTEIWTFACGTCQ